MTEQRPPYVILPAGRGMAWLTISLVLLRRDALRLLLLGLLLQFLAGLTQVGALGILFVLSVPALSAGMLQAMHGVEAGMRPSPTTLFVAFGRSDRLLRLILLGGLMIGLAVGAVAVVLSGVISGLDPETLVRLEQGDVDALLSVDPAILERLMLALAVGLLVSGTLSFFAVPLIWFKNLPLGRAIMLGLSGMARNWKPLLVLGVFLGVLGLPAVLISSLVLTLSATGGEGSPLLTLLMLSVAVVYQLLLFASQYVSFREIFALPSPQGRSPSPEGQLVA